MAFACVCVCMLYACMHVCMYACMYISMCIYVCMYVYFNVCVWCVGQTVLVRVILGLYWNVRVQQLENSTHLMRVLLVRGEGRGYVRYDNRKFSCYAYFWQVVRAR